MPGASLVKQSCNAPLRRSVSSSISITIRAARSLALSCKGGRRHRPREPWLADTTSASGRGPLAMTPTIPRCSGSEQFPPNGIKRYLLLQPCTGCALQQERATADPGARQQIFHQIHQFYLKELPFITALQPDKLLDRAQGDAQLPTQPFCEQTQSTSGSGGVTTGSVRYPFICSFAII